MMKRLFKIHILLLMCLGIVLYSCQELDTVNLNAPDTERALAEPGDVESLISGSFFSWFTAVFNAYPIESWETMADILSYSWGNFGSRDLSSEPRAAIPNQTSWSYRNFVQRPWFSMYSAISSANDGLKAIEGGLEFGSQGADTPRAKAFAKFVQGLSHAMLGIIYDRAFVFDETINLETDVLELKPYQEVFAAGKAQMEEAIQLMNANSFTLPNSWIIGNAYTSDQLAQLAHTLLAKFLVMVARDPSERQAVNWNEVISHIDQGITVDFTIEDSEADWWNSLPWYHARGSTTWGRSDYKMMGSADRSTAYKDWLNLPVAQRDDIELDIADLRFWDQTRDASGKQNPGLYFGNIGNARFPSDRGTYHHSMYGSHRWPDYRANSGTGTVWLVLTKEMEFLKAEALLHTGGSLQEVVDIVNSTRVTNGGLEPATITDPVGSMSDERQALKTGSPLPNPATIWAMLKYEKSVETTLTFVGTQFTDRRGWGELVTGTPIHNPIPAQELEVLQLQVYTFGGGGPGSAPKRPAKVDVNSPEAKRVH